MRYKLNENGVTITIFVPYDCDNNCPFCINKKEYADMTGFSVDAIIESFMKLHEIMPNCNVVFTGGEPLANLEDLQIMLDNIPNTHKIFINTTLPVSKKNTEKDIINFLNENQQKITCINISRHLRKYVKEVNDEMLTKLEVPFRINCVLYELFSKSQMIDYVDRFKHYNTYIQFRKDYTKTTVENLFDEEGDYILQTLKSLFPYAGMINKDRFRCGYAFYVNDYKITYHKTLPYSTIANEEEYILTDIIIRQNGVINSDWNEYGHELNLNDLTNR